MTWMKKAFENIEGKVENAGNQPSIFSNLSKTNLNIRATNILLSADAQDLAVSKHRAMFIVSFLAQQDLTSHDTF